MPCWILAAPILLLLILKHTYLYLYVPSNPLEVFVSSAKLNIEEICTTSNFDIEQMRFVLATLFFIWVSSVYAAHFAEKQTLQCQRGEQAVNGKCEKCPAGKYQDKLGPGPCKNCPPGTYAPFKGTPRRWLCIPCKANEKSGYGATYCVKCPSGYESRCKKCVRCPPGTWFNRRLCKCENCEERKFSNSFNSKECESCPTGFTPSKPKQDRCVFRPCPDGTFWDGYECLECEYDTFRNGNMTECEKCTFGNGVNVGPWHTECLPCPAGQYISDLVPQTYTFEQSPWCFDCPGNSTTRASGKVLCREPGAPCPPNSFLDKDGDCSICPPAYYLDLAQTQCVRCPRNATSPGKLTTKCTPCPPGAEVDESNECKCSPGTNFQNGICRPCRPGEYSELGYKCLACEEGYISDEGASLCRKCPFGTYTVRDDRTKCVRFPKCPRGFFAGVPDLWLYGNGLFNLEFDPHTCLSERTRCPQKTKLVQVEKEFVCLNAKGRSVCPYRHVSDGGKKCVFCGEGSYFTMKEGRLQCIPCPKGTFSTQHNSLSCQKCFRGFKFLREFSEHSCVCDRGNYIGDDGICHPCPKNTTNDDFNSTSCSSCPPGFKLERDYANHLACTCQGAIDVQGHCVKDDTPSYAYPR